MVSIDSKVLTKKDFIVDWVGIKITDMKKSPPNYYKNQKRDKLHSKAKYITKEIKEYFF